MVKWKVSEGIWNSEGCFSEEANIVISGLLQFLICIRKEITCPKSPNRLVLVIEIEHTSGVLFSLDHSYASG